MRKILPIALIVIISIPALWALFAPLFFSVHDDMHPAWVFEMYSAIQSGQFPPRMAPNLSFGYGYPLFNFIYPLPFYIAAGFYAAGLQLSQAVQAVHITTFVLSGVFMYFWARNRWNTIVSMMVATLYLYTPYRALDIYVRGAIGENTAFMFIPLIGWSIDKTIKEQNSRYIALLGLSAAGLMLSHNIMAMAMLPLLGVYSLLVLWENKVTLKKFYKLMAGWILGAGISMYFWLPAIIDKPLMKEDAIFNYRDHFPFIKQLIYSPWKYGASIWGPNDDLSFQLGLVNWLVLFAAGLVILFKIYKRKLSVSELWIMMIAGLALFLMNIRSVFLWDLIPIISYFQFPWRLLFVTTLATSYLAGTALSEIKFGKKWLWLLVVIPMALTLPYFNPDKPREYSDDTIFKMYFAVPPLTPDAPISEDYLNVTEEYLRLPKSVEERPTSFPRLRIVSKNPENIIEVNKTSSISYEVNSIGPQTELEVYIYNFPGWNASIDEKEVELMTASPNGDIRILVPEGKHKIKVSFNETTRNKAIDALSLLGLGIALVILFKPQKKQDKAKSR